MEELQREIEEEERMEREAEVGSIRSKDKLARLVLMFFCRRIACAVRKPCVTTLTSIFVLVHRYGILRRTQEYPENPYRYMLQDKIGVAWLLVLPSSEIAADSLLSSAVNGHTSLGCYIRHFDDLVFRDFGQALLKGASKQRPRDVTGFGGEGHFQTF